MHNPQAVLDKMLENDQYSRWLGIAIDEIGEGYCKLHFTIRPEMLNGFHTVHGGILFSASDSAFAFACNSHGRLSVALDVHISFITACKVGETLTVEATEIKKRDKVGFYNVVTTNEAGEIVAVFKGTAYRTTKDVLAL
jgi:acyl-CoA thioesterase